MSVVYRQTTGQLYIDGQFIVVGYSGHGEGINSNEHQYIRNVGPIPVGDWSVSDAGDTKGPVTLRLSPLGGPDQTKGRSGFLVHGDNSRLDRTASHGCIIVPRTVRQLIRRERELIVIP